jgi:hypothetical protein
MMKSGRACWLFVALGVVSVNCSSSGRVFGPGTGAMGGTDGAEGGGDSVDGGTDGALGGGGGVAGGAAGAQGDGGDPSIPIEPPVLDTTSLPDAKFNADYAVQLAFEGTGSFEITAGDLPSGLTLGQDGKITGVPTEDGEFPFTVAVRNAAGEDAVELSLFVSRKPWLLYLANEVAEEQMTLYAIDTSTVLLTKHVVSDDLPASGSVSAFELAANGSRLAYTADVTTNDVLELYVVALEQEAVGEPRKVDTDGLPVGHFALTPSGNGVAYQVQTAASTWEYRFQDLADLAADFVTIGPSMAAEPWHHMLWVTEDRLVYSTVSANATRLRSGATFGAEVSIQAGGVTPYRELERAVAYAGFGACSGTSWLYDFRGGDVIGLRAPATGNNYAVYSPDFSLVTLTNGAGGLFVRDVEDIAGEPLGLISPAGHCSDVWWSPTNDRLVTTGQNSTSLQLTNVVDGELVTFPIEGDHTFNGTPAVSFITSDRVVFSASEQVLEFSIEDGVPSRSSLLTPENAATSVVHSFAFSADRKWAYYVLSASGGQRTPLLLDLTKPAPITPRVVLPTLASINYDSAVFSPDSSAVAVVQTGGNSAHQLFLTNLLHPTVQGTMVNVGGCNQWCATVKKWQFQP